MWYRTGIIVSLIAILLIVILFFVCNSYNMWRVGPFDHVELHTGQHRYNKLMLPLFYDKNGVFVTDCIFGDQTLACVIDTGSSHLVIGTYLCDVCKQHEGRFLRQPNMPSIEDRVIENDKITYGSQTDTLDWYISTVRFPTRHRKNTVCIDQGDDQEGDREDMDYYANVMAYGLVTHRTGSSNYSIMGLGYTSKNSYLRKKMQFLHQYPRKTIQFLVTGSTGVLTIGAEEPSIPSGRNTKHHWFEMTRKNLFLGIRLYDVVFNDTISCRQEHPGKLPYSVIFDTGSNMMDLPPKLYTLFHKHCLKNQDNPNPAAHMGKMAFVLQDKSGDMIRITLDPSVYLWNPSDPESSIVEESTNDMDHVIWSSLFMNQFSLWFDLDKHEIGVRKLK